MISIEMFGSKGIIFVFMTCAISYIFSSHTGIYASQKIGRSKSRMIEAPNDATLSYFRKNKKDFPKDTKHVLVGQFKFGRSSIELPSSEGLNIYKIKVSGKGIRLTHHAYNPDGSTWSARPIKGQLEYINLDEEKVEIHAIKVSQSYGKKDRILLINTNLWGSVEVEYISEQSKNKDVKSNNIGLGTIDENSVENIEVNYQLVGQLKIGKSIVELPNPKGRNRYVITVKGGKVRLNHCSYNPDGHTWSAPPGNGRRQHIDIGNGTHTLDIFIGEHYGQVNKIKLVNCSLFSNAEVSCYIDNLETHEDLSENILS